MCLPRAQEAKSSLEPFLVFILSILTKFKAPQLLGCHMEHWGPVPEFWKDKSIQTREIIYLQNSHLNKGFFFTVATINCKSRRSGILQTEQEENILPGADLCKDKSLRGLYIFKL